MNLVNTLFGSPISGTTAAEIENLHKAQKSVRNAAISYPSDLVGQTITSTGDSYVPTRRQRAGLCIRVEPAENGHIVHVAQREGEISKPYIAAKYEDVADIVMRELAAAALERT